MRFPFGRRMLARAAAGTLLAAGLTVAPAGPAHAAVACSVAYQKTWDNGSGFGADIAITNTGDPVDGWVLTYTWPDSQRVTNGWSAIWSQPPGSPDVAATNMPYNRSLATGATITIGFNGTHTGVNTDPTVFAVNGVTCGGQQQAVLVSPSSVRVTEGSSAVVGVRLAVRPTTTVTVTPTAGAGDTDLTFCPGGAAVLTFTPSTWNVSQPVRVCAAEDADTTNGGRTFTFHTAGAITGTLSAAEADNDPGVPPVVISPPSVFVPEGGSGTISVRLAAPPTANVTVGIVPGPGDPDLTLCSPMPLLFTPVNWNVAQTVRICAAEDTDTVDGSRIFNVGSSASFTAFEVDNDVPPPTKVDNPFAGADGYVNPDRRSQVDAEAALHPTELGDRMRAAGQQPTALWLDRIGAITAGRGLTGHLDAAVAQDAANGDTPVVVSVVLYNLPNRNCGSLSSSGELQVGANGLARYRTEYVDRIRAILARPEYANLRVAVVVEPDSLPNLVTHNLPRPFVSVSCVEAAQTNAYRDGIRYAVSQLASLPNSYLYLDFSSSAWLGWADNLNPTLNLYDQVLSTAGGGPGYDKIHGFATNTANYVAVEEIFLPDPLGTVSGQALLMSRFFDWNPRFDERDYATDVRAWFASRGCANCGVLIDTSRNGWGGRDRPVTITPSDDLNRFVNANRIDRRPMRLGWCNQRAAGLGPRPTVDTGIPGVDAFVWVKPPGESDGISVNGVADPDDPFKRFTPECDPNQRNRYDSAFPTNALPGAPHFGRFFPQHFVELVQNAYPAA